MDLRLTVGLINRPTEQVAWENGGVVAVRNEEAVDEVGQAWEFAIVITVSITTYAQEVTNIAVRFVDSEYSRGRVIK